MLARSNTPWFSLCSAEPNAALPVMISEVFETPYAAEFDLTCRYTTPKKYGGSPGIARDSCGEMTGSELS
jgi:hypothetical protein